MAKSKDNANSHVNIEQMKVLVAQYTDLGLWSAALFWADKILAAIIKDGGNEVWLVAKCLLQKGDWHRAFHIVTSRGLHKSHLLCHYVAVKALIEAKEYQQALQILTDNDADHMEHNLDAMPQNRVLAALHVALGTAHTALESRGAAAEALTTALRKDVTCYTALEILLDQHADTPDKEKELLQSLPLDVQCTQSEAAVLSAVYGSYVNRYGQENVCEKAIEVSNTKGHPPWEEAVKRLMERSEDARLARVRRLVHAGCWKEAVAALDNLGPWFGERERIACLVELHQIPQLFHYAHTLVDKYPHRAVSWFGVGCYYFAIGKNELARRYLSKAKNLEPGMGEAWLAYGHSFAADNEHDQAMAAYFKACQLLPGCHLPCLYIAVECAQLNNFAMAERFVARAAGLDQLSSNKDRSAAIDENSAGSQLSLLAEARLCHIDPHVTHEAGAVAYAVANYKDAETLFKKALKDVKRAHDGRVPPRWYVLLDNLGHACRKNGHLKESISYHEEGLSCKPGRAKAYNALGLSYALLGNTEKAIDLLHCALAKNPDDALSFSMLNELIDEYAEIGENETEIPSMDFSMVEMCLPPGMAPNASMGDPTGQFEEGAGAGDATKHSDMSMSFD